MSMTLTLDPEAQPLQSHPMLESTALLATRLGLGGIFWSSARTKVDGLLTVSDSTVWLFEEEYGLPLLSPEFAAHAATYAEHILPALLAIGLGSRLAALGLFVMTMVIQLFVYPDALLSTHLGWMALAGIVMVFGPGRFSIDQLIAARSAGTSH